MKTTIILLIMFQPMFCVAQISNGHSLIKAKEARMRAKHGNEIRMRQTTLRYGKNVYNKKKGKQECVTNIGTRDDENSIRSVDDNTVITGNTMVFCGR